jgi:hypothetical protein
MQNVDFLAEMYLANWRLKLLQQCLEIFVGVSAELCRFSIFALDSAHGIRSVFLHWAQVIDWFLFGFSITKPFLLTAVRLKAASDEVLSSLTTKWRLKCDLNDQRHRLRTQELLCYYIAASSATNGTAWRGGRSLRKCAKKKTSTAQLKDILTGL